MSEDYLVIVWDAEVRGEGGREGGDTCVGKEEVAYIDIISLPKLVLND